MTKSKAINEGIEITIPKPVENVQLPSPDLLQYYTNLENRILWLDSNVDDYWLEFEKQIIQWNMEDKKTPVEKRKPIKLMFFSYGGQLDINYSFIDVIEKSKTPIIGINMGQACSAACFIYLACPKRIAMPHATFLIHQGGTDGGFSGTYAQVVAAIMEYQRQMEELSDYIVKHTKITEEQMEEKFTSEWYLTAEEAVELGVTDSIIEDIDEIL